MKRFVFLLIGILCLIFASGCASLIMTNSEINRLLAPADTININEFRCQDCTTAWQRANLWIANHSSSPIQTSNDWLIQTGQISYEDFGVSIYPYRFTVIKEAIGDGNRIKMDLERGYGPPDTKQIKRVFYYYLQTGIDLFASAPKPFHAMK